MPVKVYKDFSLERGESYYDSENKEETKRIYILLLDEEKSLKTLTINMTGKKIVKSSDMSSETRPNIISLL